MRKTSKALKYLNFKKLVITEIIKRICGYKHDGPLICLMLYEHYIFKNCGQSVN